MTPVLRLLLKKGANVNAAGEDGWTPLMLAVRAGKLAAVEALLGAGADVAAQNQQGSTALHLAAINGKADICGLLLQRAPPGVAAMQDGSGKTAAQAAQTPELAALLSGAPS